MSPRLNKQSRPLSLKSTPRAHFSALLGVIASGTQNGCLAVRLGRSLVRGYIQTPCSLAGSARHQGGGLGARVCGCGCGGAAVGSGWIVAILGLGGLRGGCWNWRRIWVGGFWGGLGRCDGDASEAGMGKRGRGLNVIYDLFVFFWNEGSRVSRVPPRAVRDASWV